MVGTLKGFDQLMNLVLDNVQELLHGNLSPSLPHPSFSFPCLSPPSPLHPPRILTSNLPPSHRRRRQLLHPTPRPDRCPRHPPSPNIPPRWQRSDREPFRQCRRIEASFSASKINKKQTRRGMKAERGEHERYEMGDKGGEGIAEHPAGEDCLFKLRTNTRPSAGRVSLGKTSEMSGRISNLSPKVMKKDIPPDKIPKIETV